MMIIINLGWSKKEERNYIAKEQLNKLEVKIAEFQKMTMSFQNKL